MVFFGLKLDGGVLKSKRVNKIISFAEKNPFIGSDLI